jgi:hypothetical protein
MIDLQYIRTGSTGDTLDVGRFLGGCRTQVTPTNLPSSDVDEALTYCIENGSIKLPKTALELLEAADTPTWLRDDLFFEIFLEDEIRLHAGMELVVGSCISLESLCSQLDVCPDRLKCYRISGGRDDDGLLLVLFPDFVDWQLKTCAPLKRFPVIAAISSEQMLISNYVGAASMTNSATVSVTGLRYQKFLNDILERSWARLTYLKALLKERVPTRAILPIKSEQFREVSVEMDITSFLVVLQKVGLRYCIY